MTASLSGGRPKRNGACWCLGVRPDAPCRCVIPPAGSPALGPQEGEHGEHAAAVIALRAQAKLLEDARDVLLHRALGDHEALGDALVRAALGHQLEHLALTGR